jgi:hypothetical protein
LFVVLRTAINAPNADIATRCKLADRSTLAALTLAMPHR